MFAEIHFPEALKPEELDAYLERGWFRMGQAIFTTNFLHFRNEFYTAIWLRIVLPDYPAAKTQDKLLKRNAAFRTEITRTTSITPEKEDLYARYRQGITFDSSPSLNHLLLGKATQNLYHTYEVNLYDDQHLIACGYFDLGKISAAGITSFYDPAYRKYSPGKYLIYRKINFCREQGLRFFYPGYFVPGYPLFDYKLAIGKNALEYLRFGTQQWLSIGSHNEEDNLFQRMHYKLLRLKNTLAQSKIESNVWKYGYFDANLIPELADAELFDFPAFLNFTDNEVTLDLVVVYNIRDENFWIVKCISMWTSGSPGNTDGIYASHLLKIERGLASSSSEAEIASFILNSVSSGATPEKINSVQRR